MKSQLLEAGSSAQASKMDSLKAWFKEAAAALAGTHTLCWRRPPPLQCLDDPAPFKWELAAVGFTLGRREEPSGHMNKQKKHHC